MTRKDGVLLASRAFALYLLCWALTDLTYLPQEVLGFRHHGGDYLFTYYAVGVGFRVVRIIVLLAVMNWLFKGGRSVESFFFPGESRASDSVH